MNEQQIRRAAGGTAPGARDVAAAILRAADELRRRMGALAEPHGITAQQYNVLLILREHQQKPLQTLEIGALLPDRTPGTSRLLERLAAKGLVRRERPAANRRLVYCSITPAGLDVAARVDAARGVLDREVAAAAGGEAAELTSVLETLADRLAAADGT